MSDKTLIDLVLDQADADPVLSEDAKELILAALLDDDSLRSALLAPSRDTSRPESKSPIATPEPIRGIPDWSRRQNHRFPRCRNVCAAGTSPNNASRTWSARCSNGLNSVTP